MHILLESLTTWLLVLIESMGYIGIFIVSLLENVFAPIPSEAIIPAVGILIAQGKMDFVSAIIASTTGSVVGAYFFYYLGYVMGSDRMRLWIVKWGKYIFVTEQDLDRGETWFKKYGQAAVFFGRLIPLVRSIISVPAGYTKMPLIVFTLYTGLGTALWSSLLLGLGVYFGNNFETIVPYLKKFEYGILVVITMGIIYFVINKRKTEQISS